ncbi:sugar ABC transporter substrate-binding protein [Rhizobium sp. 18065]|uniref:sugar ABC transporter substrate-binding protein n=1 Tax=Rhizobium sp. 18065 TaxID=2681411 RepID=UPI00135B1C00|nr:sugar ABC transporter substrate-binding protein [Rhizobium sp. 18065]
MPNRRQFMAGVAGLTLTSTLSLRQAKAATVDFGYSVPDTTNPFLGWLTGEVKKLAEADGRRLEIADAGMSPVKQMEQIENFIAMQVKVIDIMPVDPNNVQEIIQRAQAQGIKVLVAGTDTTYYDVMMNMDQHNCGEQIAEMAMEWLTKTFSTNGKEDGLPTDDARPKVIVIGATDTVDANNRSQGILDKMNAWGKANLVTSPTEARTTASGTSVMETLWLQNPDTVCVLTYNADTAMGVNEYMMGQGGLDRDKFGVFTGDWSPPVQETIDASATGNSVFRGTMQIVGPTLDGQQVPLEVATYTLMKDLSEGKTSHGTWIKDSIKKAYPKSA